MTAHIRREDPILKLDRAVICLHAVERPRHRPQPGELPYPDCEIIRSMELDLLAYRFQIEPPFGSQCESHGRIPIEIVFPEQFTYHSEGRSVCLECEDPRRQAEAIVSSTLFLRSGYRIWHVAITPAEDDSFNEFDLIKLIHLYDGRTERTHLAERIQFHVRGDARPLSTGEFLKELCPHATGPLELKAGTVQMATGPTIADSVDMNDLLTHITAARQPGGEAHHREMIQWMNDPDSPESRVLMAFDGIVEGIFDFDELDGEEVLDTLEPTFFRSADLLRVHRSTLVSITEADRPMDQCWDQVGISPYLIIPHAVALHNEALVEAAEEVLDQVVSAKDRPRLQALEKAAREAEINLNRLYIPNVFNYVTERSLYERSRVGRGGEDQRLATVAKLAEVKSVVEQKWEGRQADGQIVTTAMLGVISLLQIKDPLFQLMGATSEFSKWINLTILAILLVVLIVYLGRRGLRL